MAAKAARVERGGAEALESGREAILSAALAAFVELGYHGASMRDIAARAGTSISHAYYYFPSKAGLLVSLIEQVTRDLIAALHAARRRAGDDPAAQLAAMVRQHVRLHTERQAESFVGNSELRSLDPESRRRMVALRDEASAVFREVVEAGRASGAFDCPHPHEAVLAIVTMCTAVAGWYRPDGPETAETLADRYAAFCLSIVGHRAVP